MADIETIRAMIRERRSVATFWTSVGNHAVAATMNECAALSQVPADRVAGSSATEIERAMDAARQGASAATVRGHLAAALVWLVAEQQADCR